MNKEIWISVTSLILMTIFMVFTSILYFNRRNMINNTPIFNGEYTDMAFEVKDEIIYIGNTEISKYEQKETYTILLNLKYREPRESNLKISLNYDELDIDPYKNTLVYVSVIDKNNNIIFNKQKIDIKNEKTILMDDIVSYSKDNYQYIINFEIYNIYDENNMISSYELTSKMSASLV